MKNVIHIYPSRCMKQLRDHFQILWHNTDNESYYFGSSWKCIFSGLPDTLKYLYWIERILVFNLRILENWLSPSCFAKFHRYPSIFSLYIDNENRKSPSRGFSFQYTYRIVICTNINFILFFGMFSFSYLASMDGSCIKAIIGR